MKRHCPNCGHVIPINGLGRRSLNLSVNNVYDALQACPSVAQAARELGCSRGYIYKVLKEQGTTPKDVIKAKAREQ